ncbi:MAG: hypothetical protein ACQCN3_02380 [Candidatus Bathyarchaeia archaeon]|jgi:hypothetical protein
MTQQQDRINALIALAVLNNKKGNATGFKDFILKECATKFCLTPSQAGQLNQIIVRAYQTDKWVSNVKENPYFANFEQERQTWLQKQKH